MNCPTCGARLEPERIGARRTDPGRVVDYCPDCDLVVVPTEHEPAPVTALPTRKDIDD